MIFPSSGRFDEDGIEGEPFLVPLAIPLVAGPSSLATVMLLMSHDSSRWLEWLIALIIAWVLGGIILFVANSLSRFFGKRGLIAIERLMGMILTTIAVQMILTGIKNIGIF
jgi:multiple antibiotic resistance protein